MKIIHEKDQYLQAAQPAIVAQARSVGAVYGVTGSAYRGRYEGHAATIGMLTGLLSGGGQNGLAGNYDWLLEWSSDAGIADLTHETIVVCRAERDYR